MTTKWCLMELYVRKISFIYGLCYIQSCFAKEETYTQALGHLHRCLFPRSFCSASQQFTLGGCILLLRQLLYLILFCCALLANQEMHHNLSVCADEIILCLIIPGEIISVLNPLHKSLTGKQNQYLNLFHTGDNFRLHWVGRDP